MIFIYIQKEKLVVKQMVRSCFHKFRMYNNFNVNIHCLNNVNTKKNSFRLEIFRYPKEYNFFNNFCTRYANRIDYPITRFKFVFIIEIKQSCCRFAKFLFAFLRIRMQKFSDLLTLNSNLVAYMCMRGTYGYSFILKHFWFWLKIQQSEKK